MTAAPAPAVSLEFTGAIPHDALVSAVIAALAQNRELLLSVVAEVLAAQAPPTASAPVPKHSGDELRARREDLGLTRLQLARFSGVADSTIRNMERSRHRTTRAVRTKIVVALDRLAQLDLEALTIEISALSLQKLSSPLST